MIYYNKKTQILRVCCFNEQMVKNGEAKCTRKSLSNIEEKTIVEDKPADVKVLNPLNKFLND